MVGRQAKIIAAHSLRRMLAYAGRSAHPLRNRAVVLLSVKAGLRACEIARLEWSMVLDARGHIGRMIELRDDIAKMGSGRRIPLHSDLRHALAVLGRAEGRKGAVVRSAKTGRAMQPNSIVNWFVVMFAELGLEGCSSHSGRRTFITRAARMIPKAGGSLRDIQLLAGHASIETTQRYIDGDTDAQRRLVRLI